MNIVKWPLYIFNAFEEIWNKKSVQRLISASLALIFLAGLLIIEVNRRGLLPPELANVIPVNHFQAVTLAFYLLLIVEIISLILIIGSSMSRSVIKELEILALIMLRNAFKTLGEMQEPIDLGIDILALASIGTNCIAAVVIFVCTTVYERLQNSACISPAGEQEPPVYAGAKKYTALILLFLFVGDGFSHLTAIALNGESLSVQTTFFARFYTLLIFADLFLLLASESATHNPIMLFRNSGYTAGALFMRMALGAPHFWDAGLGMFAALYILAVSYAIKRLNPC